MATEMQNLITEYVTAVKKIYGNHLKQVILYGSYARGEARVDSDIDLRLEVDREQGFGLFALSAFGEAVREETGRQVDLVSSDHLDDDLAAVIEREGVILYDRA